MGDQFQYDVFLSHSKQDKAVVRPLAERLRQDGLKVWFDEWVLKPGDSIPAKIEEGMEHSRVLVLCMSANAFGSDWAQLESGTFRFRDPLNKERRFLPLRLDNAPIKGSLAQFLHVNWPSTNREQEYARLAEACRALQTTQVQQVRHGWLLKLSKLGTESEVDAYAFNSNGKRAITCGADRSVRLWDLDSDKCIRVLRCHRKCVCHIEWSEDERRALVWTDDDNVRLIDVEHDRVLTDYGKTLLTKRQMDCFRLLAGGLSSAEIRNHLGLWVLTVETHLQELRQRLNLRTRNELRQFVARFYGIRHHARFPPLQMDWFWVPYAAWNLEKEKALSKDWERFQNLRLCTSFGGGRGEQRNPWKPVPWNMAWNATRKYAVSGSAEGELRLWNVEDGKCLRIFEGHTKSVESVVWHTNEQFLLSGSLDCTVKLWNVETGKYLCEYGPFSGGVRRVAWDQSGLRALVGTGNGMVYVLDLANFFPYADAPQDSVSNLPATPKQVQYCNAKVLVVGDTHSGKTGLTHRLATGQWKPSEDSTVGAWSTQWALKDAAGKDDEEREIWLWDFGGQADQRLVHLLYMDGSRLILQLFDADQEDVLPGLRDWQTALRRCVKEPIPQFLIAGRIDAGFKASKSKIKAYADEQKMKFFETSAKEGTGCKELKKSLIETIPWEQMTKRTSPHAFKLIKDQILKLRDEGQVLHTFKELRELLWGRLPEEARFSDDTLRTVIGLLDGPGVVKELDYGTYILLAPEWINSYAQAVLRTLRNDDKELGTLPLRNIAEGRLLYQHIGRDGKAVEMKRLTSDAERVVLGEMERQLEERGLCLRQGDKLVFPSHCGRDRPKMQTNPVVFVSYAVKGYLDDIYATLVVKLTDCGAFSLKELWRDAADFVTLEGEHHMGIKLRRLSGSNGEISIYFGKGVSQQEQVIFANYIHAHLHGTCDEEPRRLRHYVCPHCHTAKGNPEALMQKLMAKQEKADVECDLCERRFPLWDPLEKKFASKSVCDTVLGIQKEDDLRLTTRRQGKLLVLEVGSRITSANQKWFEIPTEEDDGIDIQMEFTDEAGNGVGKGLCLQLKAGNSFLRKRKTDGVEVFTIKKQRWLKTWINQPYPVMLVIGTLPVDRDHARRGDKLQFESIRWMEITSVLKRLSANGTKPVKQIEFHGEEVNMTTVMHWRKKVHGAPA